MENIKKPHAMLDAYSDTSRTSIGKLSIEQELALHPDMTIRGKMVTKSFSFNLEMNNPDITYVDHYSDVKKQMVENNLIEYVDREYVFKYSSSIQLNSYEMKIVSNVLAELNRK